MRRGDYIAELFHDASEHPVTPPCGPNTVGARREDAGRGRCCRHGDGRTRAGPRAASHPDFHRRYRNFTGSTLAGCQRVATVTAGSELHRPGARELHLQDLSLSRGPPASEAHETAITVGPAGVHSIAAIAPFLALLSSKNSAIAVSGAAAARIAAVRPQRRDRRAVDRGAGTNTSAPARRPQDRLVVDAAVDFDVQPQMPRLDPAARLAHLGQHRGDELLPADPGSTVITAACRTRPTRRRTDPATYSV